MKRLLAALLTLSMLVGIVPFSAFAESPGAVPETFAAAQESPGLDDETVQSGWMASAHAGVAARRMPVWAALRPRLV